MRISAATDSIEKQNLQKEMNAKIDSLNKVNAPKLQEFVKGLKALESGKEKSAYIQGLGIGQQISQQMLPQFNQMVLRNSATQKNQHRSTPCRIGQHDEKRKTCYLENGCKFVCTG